MSNWAHLMLQSTHKAATKQQQNVFSVFIPDAVLVAHWDFFLSFTFSNSALSWRLLLAHRCATTSMGAIGSHWCQCTNLLPVVWFTVRVMLLVSFYYISVYAWCEHNEQWYRCTPSTKHYVIFFWRCHYNYIYNRRDRLGRCWNTRRPYWTVG